MVARMRSALPWHLLVSILILGFLARWQGSLCDSVGTRTIHKLPRSTSTSFDQFDSHLESDAFKRVADDSVSPVGAMPSRLVLETAELHPIESSKEVEALMAFKSGITSDPLGMLNGWRATDSDPCSWMGVGCSNNSSSVTTLDLRGLQLLGTVSALLGQLSFLQELDLSKNNLSGSIPTSLTNCSNMFHLNMSFNQLIGDIPTQVGQLENLQTLDISNNNLTGEIPGSLSNCSSLKHLDLGTNNVHGSLPSQFGTLSNLKFLSLESTAISGSIPFTLGNCSSLTQLWLSYNPALGGELPPELGDLMRLQDLRITTCNFQGSFPTWVFNFTAMQRISMGFNHFFNHIPDAFGQLPDLSFLSMENNVFSGEIPRSIVNTSLQTLALYSNKFTGNIPYNIGLLGTLKSLYLYDNALSGLIPTSLSNCSFLQLFMVGINPFDPQILPSWIGSFTYLRHIYLAETNLQGEIPLEVGQLSQLVEMTIYSNNLTGKLPATLGNCTALSYIDVRSNQLSGRSIPSELGLLPLMELQIGYNSFSAGPVPSFIYNLTKLGILGIAGDNFNGNLDGDFGKFEQLFDFEASDNNFQGPIPESLSNCSNLVTLDMGGNNFSGEIPPSLANLTNLVFLALRKNNIQGTIRTDFTRNFRVLQHLDLSENKLGGAIPVNVGQLSYLQSLSLFANDLKGVLPSSLANCTVLLSVDLSHNRLTGNIPGDAFARTSSLASLNLSDNLLSGSWPSQFSQLTDIVVINVSANNLSGSIPSGLGRCILLQTLDLSFNQFTGAIPQDLGMLTSLTSFNASYNMFDGPIPTSGAFKTNLTAASFLGNPGLCGGILGPQRHCPLNSTSHSCKGFKCTRVWVSLVSTLGTIIILIGVSMLVFYYPTKKGSKHQELVFYTVTPHERFEEADILEAMASGEDSIIGVGAKSVVYKAVLPSGEAVAIKVLKDLPIASDQDEESKRRQEQAMESEAHTLAKLRHRNIIKVFSLCSTLNVKAIILECMPQGSLHAHLHGAEQCKLSWAQRFKILLGVTHGMLYLHHEFPDPIIHRDLKPSNILLDADMEPKVCDFDICRYVTDDHGEATASTFCGTFGYIPPEYGTEARLSTKGDVYSYGVVLLELLTAKDLAPTDDITHSNKTQDVVGIVERYFQESESSLFELFDPTLRDEAANNATVRKQMILTIRVGILCTMALPKNRPSMKSVLEMLLQIKDVGQGSMTVRTLDELLADEVISTPESHDSE